MMKSKINVCRIIYEFIPGTGGSVIHTVELSRHMVPYVNRQFIIAPRLETDTAKIDGDLPFDIYRVNYCRFALLRRFKKRVIPFLPIAPLIHISFGMSAIKKVMELNKKHGIDIIHTHGVGTGPAGRIAGIIIKKPVVWMVDGTCLAYSKISGAYETIVTRFFKPMALLVVDDGSRAPEKFTKILKNRTTVVYHGIDTNIYAPMVKSKNIMSKMGLNRDNFIVFSPHSLIPVKGVEYAIEAFGIFIGNYQINDAFLIIAGKGHLEQKLKHLANTLKVTDHILFIDSIEHSKMPEYYALADIVLATSASQVYGNMNLVVQEAMACGKPVLAFNTGNTSRIIVDGYNGLLAEPGDVVMLANNINIIYEDKKIGEELGNNAREFIIKNKSWEKRIRQELLIYEKLLCNEDDKDQF